MERSAPLIAFVHIPKTAGGTVVNMLGRAYSRAAVHDGGNVLLDPERTAKKVARAERWQRRGGRVIAGHVPFGLFREHLPPDTRYITLLRDPVERVLSHYHGHLRLTGTVADDRRRERGLVIVESIEEALELRLPQVTNLATRFLSGDPAPMGTLPPHALDDAKDNLRRFTFVGVQERFDESVLLLQRTLGLEAVPFMNRHVSVGRPRADEIPDAERELIAEHNQLDAELFALGETLVDDAVANAGDGFAADVEQLRAVAAQENQTALDTVRDWLDRELPRGSSKRKEEVFEAAAAAGVSIIALRRAVGDLALVRGRDDEGRMVWTRT